MRASAIVRASICFRYAKSHNVEIGDALIAASAAQSNAALWTRNRKHYPMPELTMHAEGSE